MVELQIEGLKARYEHDLRQRPDVPKVAVVRQRLRAFFPCRLKACSSNSTGRFKTATGELINLQLLLTERVTLVAYS